MTVEQILTDQSKWIRNEWARNSNGSFCSPLSPSATCFCLDGALWRAYPEPDKFEAAHKKLAKVIKARYPHRLSDKLKNPLPLFNDHEDTTFEEVIAVAKEAGV